MTEQSDLEILLLLTSNVGGNTHTINSEGGLFKYDVVAVVRDGDVHDDPGVVDDVLEHEQWRL